MAKILIIDDDATMAPLLKTLLELDGYEASFVRDWGDVVAYAERERPALVLLDCILPGIEGPDIARQIRASSVIADVKIVMTSGLPREDECMSAGADAFLLKPYPPDELLSTIRGYIGDDGRST
jgi:DNA-binding response OmpR family regulator